MEYLDYSGVTQVISGLKTYIDNLYKNGTNDEASRNIIINGTTYTNEKSYTFNTTGLVFGNQTKTDSLSVSIDKIVLTDYHGNQTNENSFSGVSMTFNASYDNTLAMNWSTSVEDPSDTSLLSPYGYNHKTYTVLKYLMTSDTIKGKIHDIVSITDSDGILICTISLVCTSSDLIDNAYIFVKMYVPGTITLTTTEN